MKTLSRFCFAVIILYFTAAAHASSIIDQAHDPIGNNGTTAALSIGHDRGQIQTFTVGTPGLLTDIEVKVGRGSSTIEPLVMSIWSTDILGLPNQELFSSTVGPEETHSNYPLPFISFNLSSISLSVLTGDYLAIVLESDALNTLPFNKRYNWEIGGEYAFGIGYTKYDFGLVEQSIDFHFKTYVTAVPLPSSIILLISGLMGLSLKMRS